VGNKHFASNQVSLAFARELQLLRNMGLPAAWLHVPPASMLNWHLLHLLSQYLTFDTADLGSKSYSSDGN
jgi:hypothetical protein